MSQKTISGHRCSSCGHSMEAHKPTGRSEQEGVLRLRLACDAGGCGCLSYSGEIWNQNDRRAPVMHVLVRS